MRIHVAAFFRGVSMIVAVWLVAAGTALAAEPDCVPTIRPIFERHCYACHGPEKQTSSYRLDFRDFRLTDVEGKVVHPILS